MKRIAFTLVTALAVSGPSPADLITQGLDLKQSALGARLTVTQVKSDSDVLRIQVGAEAARNIKGYGFVLTFDPEQFEYVRSEEADASMISTNGNAALMVHKNHEAGRVAVGAVQVDGSSASGNGQLAEVVFRKVGDAGLSDFRLVEGIMVDLAGETTEVPASVLQNVSLGPTDYGLQQNVPNPFNPETTISYQLRESGRALLTVYSSLGQEIRTLVDEVQEVGAYTVRWDGRDSFGRQVASGVYFYKMRSGTFSDQRRMMLLK